MSPEGTIAHYRVIGKIGEGGMGAVYRATDTRLNREVAIKVLPDNLSSDAEYVARFQREAQMLGSLNHPNIAILHGIEQNALIMELVPGVTLSERIKAGRMPLAEVAAIGIQIAAALEAAHEKGLVHRDLKPSNVKVTPDGVVKVLDFGIAKTADQPVTSGSSDSTTQTIPTHAGMILGTAAYMSPEQASGRRVDRRADIWSFGVVLYEMVSGERLFEGESVAHTLAHVLTREIKLDTVDPAFRPLIRRCLQRDPRKRLRDIGDALLALEEYLADPAPAARPVRRAMLPWAVAAAVAIAGAAGWWKASRSDPSQGWMRFSVDLGADAVRDPAITVVISPDGRRLVYPVRAADETRLATRTLDQPKATVLAGTEGASQPFFSPDGQWVGFFADQKLKKIPVQGGATVTLCEVDAVPRGAAWGEDGNIIANLDTLHLVRVPASGGQPQMLEKPEDHGERTWRWPQILPGGEHVLFTGITASGIADDANIEVLSLKTNQVKVVQRGGYWGRYLPSGHLIYIHQGTLFAMPFDRDRLEARGVPAPVLEEVAAAAGTGGGQLDFSQNGTLVYLTGPASNENSSFVWTDASGKTELLYTAAGATTPKLSPNGKLLAFERGNISVYDPVRASTVKLNSTSGPDRFPVWMPDGRHIVFAATAGNDPGLWWIRSDGSTPPQKLYGTPEIFGPTSISPDGKNVAFTLKAGGQGQVWMLPLDLSDPERPKPGQPAAFVREPSNDAAFSADGRWVAYTSFEAGTAQVSVRPFPAGASGKWQISNAGGRFPMWSRNGRELFYLGADNRIMVAGYSVKGELFAPDRPRQWSSARILRAGNFSSLDLAPDGKRFVTMFMPPQEGDKGSLHAAVVLNFFDEHSGPRHAAAR